LIGARRFSEALPYLRSAVAAFAEYAGHLNTLISCCGPSRTDRRSQGIRRRAQQDRAAAAPRRAARSTCANFAHRDIFIEGIAKAGVPE